MGRRSTLRTVPAAAGVLLAAALTLTGCSADDSGVPDRATDRAAAPANKAAGAEAAAGTEAAAGAAAGDRAAGAPSDGARTAPRSASSIVRTVSLTVRVKDVPEALAAARAAAEDAGGYVGDESTTRGSDGHERTRVVLRVPVDSYREVLTELEGAGRLVSREAKAEDVTDQVVDVESRIASQRASVARVRELMDQATRLSDIVALEGELGTRQAELESLLARQKSLKDRASLATITLSLSETAPQARDSGEDDGPGFADALSGGWDAFVTVLRWLLLVIGAVLPFAAVGAVLLLVWLRVLRPLLARRAPAAPFPPAAPLPGPAGAEREPAGRSPLPAAPPVAGDTGPAGPGGTRGESGPA
ncbi:DUF4349 domain-containing protein [Streptomyces sp. SID8352]|uniref:DUF4349 domain-containing protein n=1 Tax=Streptomyces sp. SID8352 TaxID=2690338 RepID=UPI0013718A38|nr:DUF4349 domain-containing protein [Streptomyces sp. SID8352]